MFWRSVILFRLESQLCAVVAFAVVAGAIGVYAIVVFAAGAFISCLNFAPFFAPRARPSLGSRKMGKKKGKNGRKKCQMTCKPGSVTAAIAADDGYSSRMAVTSHLKQPTRT